MKTYFDTYEFDIAANGFYRLDSYNSFLTLLKNSSVTAVKVGIGGDARASLEQGLSIELPQGDKFNYLLFRNPTGAIMTIKVALSIGRVYDNRLVISGTIPVDDTSNNIETPAALAVPASPAAATSIAANSDQKELIIENTGDQVVWIGDANVSAANERGKSIGVGDTVIYTTTAQVYLQSVAAGAGQVSYTRLKKV